VLILLIFSAADWQAHAKIQHIQKMADVMWSAVKADSQPTNVMEYMAQLQLENATLRELLGAGRHSLESPVCSQAAQTDITSVGNSSVIDISQHEPANTEVETAVQPQTSSDVSQLPAAAAASASDVTVNNITQDESNCPILNL